MIWGKLSDYPCKYEVFGRCEEECAFDDEEECELGKFFREVISLRKAVLGDLPPEVAAYVYRNAATLYDERGNAEAAVRFRTLADTVEKLGDA